MSTYEVLPEIVSEDGEAKLYASWTPNNGRRIGIMNLFDESDREHEQFLPDGWDNCWREFDLTREQAKMLGEALLRWAADDH